MSYFHAISGSPSTLSRNSFLLQGLEQRLAPYGIELRRTHAIELQPFKAGASDREDWAGCMKTLLQFLPAGALQYRPLILIGTGGSIDELPNLERSLGGELTRLNGRLALSSIHIGPKNWIFTSSRPPWLTAGTELRVNRALEQLHSLAEQAVAVS
jgi:NAD(P)H-dependent FMN reductase